MQQLGYTDLSILFVHLFVHQDPGCCLRPSWCWWPSLGQWSCCSWGLCSCPWPMSPQRVIGSMYDEIRGPCWACPTLCSFATLYTNAFLSIVCTTALLHILRRSYATMLVGFCQYDSNYRHLERKNSNRGAASTRLAHGHTYGAFFDW